MTLRRRIALFLDPSLAPEIILPEQRELTLDMSYAPLNRLASHAEHIARTLDKIEARRRRPRNVWCEHPELHPELEGRDPRDPFLTEFVR